MWKILCISILFLYTPFVHAYVPNIVTQTSLLDIDTISDPELSQGFYGEMTGFPHTFEITESKPFHLYVQVRMPDIDSSTNDVSGIIIKERAEGGRVIEVARLPAKDASWSTRYESVLGDVYREGSTYEMDVEAGTYRIEVHTINNLEKYILTIGRREEMTLGYFEFLGRLVDVKYFYEKSSLRVIESPYVYGPVIVIAVCIFSAWFYFRRRRSIS